MKKNYLLHLLVLLVFTFAACKKPDNSGTDPTQPVPNPTQPVLNLTLKEVSVIVPGNSTFKPAGSNVLSYGLEHVVDAGGKSKVSFEKGSSTVAYVFNTDKKLVLAGFITDSTNVISPATTAKVLLYLGYNIPLQPDTLSEYFLNNIDKLVGAKEWEKEFETLFLADPLTMTNQSFVAPLKARMAKMINQTPPIDIRGKAADLQVDKGDIKSGLQLSDDGLSKFKITNYYRRRAHSFLYKMSYKDMAGLQHNVKSGIDFATKADKDMKVSTASAVTGFLSEIGKTIEGKGLESFSVASGPFPLELSDNESEALYKIRIVGPGMIGLTGLTDAEARRLDTLEMQTFFIDFLLPAMKLMSSKPKKPVEGVMPSVNVDRKVETLTSILKAIPEILPEIKKGNYKGALSKLLEYAYKDITGKLMKELFMITLDNEGPNGQVSALFNANFEKFLYILAMTDKALGASDLVRISTEVSFSTSIEEWQIKARSGQVKLEPKNSVVVPNQPQKLTAEIKNNTQTAYYEWSTSGKYGKLSDTKGHTDMASFSSPDKDVFNVSRASAASLSNGDNLEYIYVTAFAGGIKVGTDTAVINVKKEKYAIKPNGVTVSGKVGTQNEVKLYLEKPDGSNTIKPNNDVSYKVVWTTAGKYGKLNGKNISSVTTLTAYDDNAVWYECLDKDTKEGIETITARIYSKAKSAAESEYLLFDEVIGTVKINNDAKKRIFHVSASLYHFDEKDNSPTSSQPGSNICYKATVAYVPEDKDAMSYSIKFYGQPPPAGYTNQSWTPTNHSFYGPAFGIPKYSGGKFTVVYDWGSRGSLAGQLEHVNWGGSGGMAEVTITLK